MERKLTRMRAKHAQTREYMEINALRGIVKDGPASSSTTISMIGLAQQSVDFVLGPPTRTCRASAARCCAT
jgi:hypothetical protein